MLKSSAGLGLALMLLQAAAPLMATGGAETKTAQPAEGAIASTVESVLSGPAELSISLRQALGDPNAVETIREVLSDDVDTSKIAFGFRYHNDTGASVLLVAAESADDRKDPMLYLLNSSADEFMHTTFVEGTDSVRWVIKPQATIEMHAALPGHTQSFRLIKASGGCCSFPVSFRWSVTGAIPQLFPVFTGPQEATESKD
jgi:hypothetical protein